MKYILLLSLFVGGLASAITPQKYCQSISPACEVLSFSPGVNNEFIVTYCTGGNYTFERIAVQNQSATTQSWYYYGQAKSTSASLTTVTMSDSFPTATFCGM